VLSRSRARCCARRGSSRAGEACAGGPAEKQATRRRLRDKERNRERHSVVVIVIPSDSLRVSLLPAVRVWYASAAGNRTMKLSHGGAPWPRAETEFSTLFLPWQSRRARPLCRRTHLILPRGGLQPRAPPPRSRRHGPLAPSRPHRVRPL
jgi:hypothetical protein